VRGRSTVDPFFFYILLNIQLTPLFILGSAPAATVGVTAALPLEETDEDTDSEGGEYL